MNNIQCNALQNNGDRCIISKNIEKVICKNKEINLCKRHIRVYNNNNLKIFERIKKENKVEEIIESVKNLTLDYEYFCGKSNLINFINIINKYNRILITGPSGIGKSYCLRFVFNHNYDVIIYKEGSLIKFFEDNENKCVFNKKKIIVVDNIEDLSDNELKEVIQILNKNILKNKTIFICNEDNLKTNNFKYIKIIKEHVYNIKFIKPNLHEMFNFIKKIHVNKKLNISDIKLKELILEKQQDMRSIINDLLFYKNTINNLHIVKKDYNQNVFEAFKYFNNVKLNYQERIILCEKYKNLDIMIFENYLKDNNLSMINSKKIIELLNLSCIIEEYSFDYKNMFLSLIPMLHKMDINFINYPCLKNTKRKRDIEDEYNKYKRKNIRSNLTFSEFIIYKDILNLNNR